MNYLHDIAKQLDEALPNLPLSANYIVQAIEGEPAVVTVRYSTWIILLKQAEELDKLVIVHTVKL